MRGTSAEESVGEWRAPDPERVRALLERDRELNPLSGQRLRVRIRNFRPEADNYIASLGGPLPYMRRLRAIEDDTERHLERLAAVYAKTGGDATAWRRIAARWNFSEVNDLIERHNRWYPLEARLAMDPRSRDFIEVGGRPYRREPLDAAWILERFPA